jgi:hypothetical protein
MHFAELDKTKLINGADIDKCPYVRYSYSQAVKYGFKGSKYAVLNKILEVTKAELDTVSEAWQEIVKLDAFIDKITNAVDNPTSCYRALLPHNKSAISVGGKMHQGNILLKEFYQRVTRACEEYGARTKIVAENNNADWKALSHAYRAVIQTIMLKTTGTINFPLTDSNMFNIKYGKMSYEDTQTLITDKFAELNTCENNILHYSWDQEYVNTLILNFY